MTKKKQNVKISKELRDIIHGYIMSDGYINPAGALTVDQSINQAKFVEWLYEKLEPLRTSRDTPIAKVSRLHNRTKTESQSRRFNTRALLKGFHFMWYKPYINGNGKTRYKKCLPKSLNCFFNETTITLWFAGDGTKIVGSKGAKFEVTSYTSAERLRLQTLFKKKFNISTVIIKTGQSRTGNQQWNLCINASEYDKFRALITKMDLIPKLFPDKLCKKS